MKLHTWLVILILLLLAASSTHADKWQFDVSLHKLPGLFDATQRLTKDLGGIDLFLAARQYKEGSQSSNHLNFSIRGGWFGIEYLTGQHVTNEMHAFSLFRPGSEKAQAFKTPCSEVLHSYIQTEFDGGFVKMDWYRKGGTKHGSLDEFKVHARAEW